MKPVLSAVLAVIAAGTLAGCRHQAVVCGHVPVQPAPAAVSVSNSAPANSLAERPEKLSFPPLKFEPPKAADYRVQLKSGPVAYVVPDRTLPLVNIGLYVRTGQYLEPAGKEGLADLTGWLLAHGGAGTNTAEQLEERLAFLAADLDANIGDTQGGVSLNLLSKDLDEGLGVLRDVLFAPRFQADKIALRRQQILQDMKQRNDDSASIEGREKMFLAFGEDFWMNRYPTAASVESITGEDIAAFHRRWFHPQNFIVAVSGDFDRAEMVAKLEKLFAGQESAEPPPGEIPTNTVFCAPGIYLVDKPDVNQGRVSIFLPGIQRDNPDAYAITIMNDILGGGGFTSRILNRVRSDEGLAYSAGSRFNGGVYFPFTFTALFQSKSRTVAYATSIVLEELEKIKTAPVTEAELNIAKRAYIERFPRTFASKSAIANVFASEEFTGRLAKDPGYYQNYRNKINAVTAADVQRVAKQYLTPEKLAILIVGNRADILLGHPNHAVKLTDLANGKLIDLPLRDPLTMKPTAKLSR
ncbi:MAG: pitrilysin family protein [Verrucomicrobiota bacterium]